MTSKVSSGVQQAAADAAVDRLDAGAGAGKIEIRDGAQATNITDASPGTLLASPTFSATAFGAANSSGVATANSITSDTNAPASGDAASFRCYADGAADTAAEMEGKAGEAADTPEMEFDNKTIVAGGTVSISSMTYTQPGS